MQKDLFIAKSLRKLKIIQKGCLLPFNFNLKKRFSKATFKIPIIRNIGWNNIFDNEPWMGQLLERLMTNKKAIFLDIGANIGQTMLKAKNVFLETPYFGFEVNPVCTYYLLELIKRNKFKYSYIIPVGLSEKPGLTILNFFNRNQDDPTATILEHLRPDSIIERREYVYLTHLDEIMQSIEGDISIIKIDVEGAELEVIKGAVMTIKKHLPVILIEILPAYNSDNIIRVERQIELEKIIRSLGYNILQIVKDNKNNLASFRCLDSIGINSNIAERDYVFIPKDMNPNALG